MRASSTWRPFGFALLASLSLGCEDGSKAAAEADAAVLEEASKEWGELRRCLIGPPLAEGEKASARMRASELTLVARGVEDASWPSSCTSKAEALEKRLDELASEEAARRHAPLGKVLRELADTRPTMMIATDVPVVDRLFDTASAAGLVGAKPALATSATTSASADEPATAGSALPEGPGVAPPPSRPLPVAELAQLGVSKGYIERVEKAPGATVRFMIGDSDAGAFFCALASGEAPLDHARCAAIEGEINVAATPLSAESPDADYFWNAEPKPVVRQVGGESFDVSVTQTAFVFDGGTIGDVVPTQLKPEMVRRLTRGKVERAPLKPPGGGGLIGFRAGAIVWRGPVRGASGRRPLVLQELKEGRAALSGRLEVGEIPKGGEHLLACRSGDQLHALVVDGDPAGEGASGERQVAWARRAGPRWRKPVRATIDVGAGAPSWWERGVKSLTCQGEGATFTWLREDRRVGQLRCRAEGCEVATSEPLPSISAKEKIRVSNLGEAALVVRTSRANGPLTGLTELVSMRLAPVAELAEAPERVLLGDRKHGGLPDLHKSLGLISIDAAAVVLVHSGPTIYGLRIGGDGQPSELRLDEGGT